MASAASLLFFVVVVVAVVVLCGASPSRTGNSDCPPPDVVVKPGETRLIKETHDIHKEGTFGLLKLPVSRATEELTLHLSVEGSDGQEYSAVFSAGAECFPSNDTWYEVMATGGIYGDPILLQFYFVTPTCWRLCVTTNAPQGLRKFSVMVRGSSQWLLEEPAAPCDYNDWLWGYFTNDTCTSPPSPWIPSHGSDINDTPETPTGIPVVKITIVVVAVVAVVVMVVAYSLGMPVFLL